MVADEFTLLQQTGKIKGGDRVEKSKTEKGESVGGCLEKEGRLKKKP